MALRLRPSRLAEEGDGVEAKVPPDEETLLLDMEKGKRQVVQPSVDGASGSPSAPFKVTAHMPWWAGWNPLVWLLLAVDVVIMVATQLVCDPRRPLKAFSRPVVVDPASGATRHELARTGLRETAYGCRTLWDVCARAFARFRGKRALGTRRYLGTRKNPGFRFPKRVFGAVEWETYGEVEVRAKAFGAGLRALGVVPLPADEGRAGGVRFDDTCAPHAILLYEDTSADWLAAFMGALSQSMVLATSYATLGVAAVASAAAECNASVVLCNYRDVGRVLEACTASARARAQAGTPLACPVSHIVYTTNLVTAAEAEAAPTVPPGVSPVKVMSMEDVVQAGLRTPMPCHPPTPDNVAVVMYTSGSTGAPKGVVIRHRNLMATIAALLDMVGDQGLVEGTERYLAYLPAAHILELCVEVAMFAFGAEIGYADVRTISSKGACRRDEATGKLYEEAVTGPYPTSENLNFAPGGIQCFRPTFMAAVPKIWDVLKKGVEEQLRHKHGLVRGLVHVGFAWRQRLQARGLDSPLFALLFGRVFRPILGGRQKLFATGGGPVAAEVQSFIRTMFCCPLVQGYALTETCCAGAIQLASDPRDGIVGPPITSVEIRLRDCTEPEVDPATGRGTGRTVASVLDRDGLMYLATDRKHQGMPCRGRGEVLIRGPSVSAGYLKQPAKTAEAFDRDGWFHTGDIALFTPDGCLKIVDRLKNMVKLRGAEYIALESMEKEYGKSIFVNAINGGVLCYGDGDMDRPVAIVQANMSELRRWWAVATGGTGGAAAAAPSPRDTRGGGGGGGGGGGSSGGGISLEGKQQVADGAASGDAGGGGMSTSDAARATTSSTARATMVASEVDAATDDELCMDPAVAAFVLEDLNREGRRGGVAANERLAAVTLVSGSGSPVTRERNSPWTSENGYLTASNKVREGARRRKPHPDANGS